jgi:hypothetical protein
MYQLILDHERISRAPALPQRSTDFRQSAQTGCD